MAEDTCPRCGSTEPALHFCTPPAPPPDSGASFSDRYRGTEWESASSREVHLPIQQSGSRGPSALLIAGLALVAIAVMGGLVLFANNLPSGRSALDESISRAPQRTPIRPPTLPPPTASPAPTFAAEPSPTPRVPLPTHDLPDDPALAFAARMAAGSASYIVDVRGEFVIGNDVADFRSTSTVSGSDLAGEYEYSLGRIRVASDVVIKSGKQYERPQGEEWTRMPGVPNGMPGDLMTSFETLDWRMMQSVGAVRRDGQRLHHLRIPELDWEAMSELFLGDAGVFINDMRLDLWVNRAGMPVEARFTIDGTSSADGVEVDYTIALDYAFSRFGDTFTIEAPTDYTDYEEGGVSS